MNKILKIERQKWMPKWATHWAFDVYAGGQIEDNLYYQYEKGELKTWDYEDGTFVLVPIKIKKLLRDWDYVYEITEPTTD